MKKTTIASFLLLLMCGLTACGGSSEENTTTDDTQEIVEETVVEEIEEIPEIEVTKYKASTYKVGTDLSAGEYVLFCDSYSGYFEVDKDSSGDFESIIANDNFDTNTIVTVSDGQYFTMSGCYAVPIVECRGIDFTGAGMFKIGYHLPAGEYKVEVYEDSILGYGYLEVSSDSTHSFNSIVTNDNFEGAKYITVSDGQYLTLTECYIVNRPMTEAEVLSVDKHTYIDVLLDDDFAAYLKDYDCLGTRTGMWDDLSAKYSTNDEILTEAKKDMELYLEQRDSAYSDTWTMIETMYDKLQSGELKAAYIAEEKENEYYEYLNLLGALFQSR